MAMTVLNNTAAMLGLGELNKNITKVGKDLARISKGERYTGAGDGAAEYSVSEKMRVRIRALAQDEQNVQNGASLLRCAEGGMQEIVDELRNLKELALNSANDHNTDQDRATIQKEIDQKIQNIDDIAQTTNYNGRLLLDGTWRMPYEKFTRTMIPETSIAYEPRYVKYQIGSRDIQVTVDTPSVTKIKDVTSGNTLIRQDNDLKHMTENFTALYGCEKASVTSFAGFACDTGFKNNGNWNWGEEISSPPSVDVNATALSCIQSFNRALDNTTLVGNKALDYAVSVATNGVFSSLSALKSKFMSDVAIHAPVNNFLQTCCDIDLTNADTGAITGLDANGGPSKNAEDIVPEYTQIGSWGLPTPGGTTNFDGLTVHWPSSGVNGTFSQAEEAILRGLNSEWTKNSLDLIKESLNMDFKEAGTNIKDIKVEFRNTNTNDLAYVDPNRDANGRISLVVNMNYYNGIDVNDPNGSTSNSGGIYLDRTLAHEFTHAVMVANIERHAQLPLYIMEGMAEIVHGIDDVRANTIEYFAGPNGATYLDNMLNGTTINDPTKNAQDIARLQTQLPYAGGYIFLRYMAAQVAHAGNTESKNSPDTDIAFSTTPTTTNQVGIDIDFSQFSGLTIPDDFHKQGFAILCSGCNQFINITFDKDRAVTDSTFDRSVEDTQRSDYVIGIQGLTTVEQIEEAIFNGAASTNIYQRGGVAYKEADKNDIYVKTLDSSGNVVSELSSVVLDGYHGVRIAKKPDGSGYMFIKDYSPQIGFLDSGTIIATEEKGTSDDLPPGVIDEDGNEVIALDAPRTITVSTPIYGGKWIDEEIRTTTYHVEEEYLRKDGNPLYIHTGTKSNQNLALYINDMSASAIGVDKVNVCTRQQATDSLDIIDSALQYALDEVTRVGAYQSRLEFTLENIVTNNENTTASESTLRDADMAKEMTSYTKNNVIAQASQAMLAQANQMTAGALNLLQ